MKSRISLRSTSAGHDACGAGFLADRNGRSRFDIVPLALIALARMDHRGGLGSDSETGDGAGLLTSIPWALLVAEAGNGIDASMAEQGCGVASLFLPSGRARAEAVRAVSHGLEAAGLLALIWRRVPANQAVLGRLGRSSMPSLFHAVVSRPEDLDDDAYERRLFVARREMEARARIQGIEEFYVASLSHRTIVYKALLRGSQLRDFYADLRSREFRTSFAVFHNRFSTNTHPSWARTQPFRQLAHNGEINTIEGNRRFMDARGRAGAASGLGLSDAAASPLIPPNESDSASLDEAFRLLTAAGHSSLEAISMLIPPAWENDPDIPPPVRAFHEGASRLMEPWDGPALIPFADGRIAGAVLDRNGLRPARTVFTTDGLVMVASEAGVLDVNADRVADRGRLGPGGFLAVDLEGGRVIDRTGLNLVLAGSSVTRHKPADDSQLEGAPSGSHMRRTALEAMAAFGYTREELQFVVGPMARDAAEPLGSMGDDTPLACLSEKPRLLFSFFKQRFAQVTNPPIDPLREPLVMSLRTTVGRKPNALKAQRELAMALGLSSPVLTEAQIESLTLPDDEGHASVSLLFSCRDATENGEMERALNRVLHAVVREFRSGATRIVLSDRGLDSTHAAVPSLLAVSAVHQRLVALGLRLQAGLIVETGEARDDHQVATLLAFGADAVCPYGLFEATRLWVDEIDHQMDRVAALRNVARAIEKGLLKILSKMGISTLRSYQGAQLFEIIGLDRELVDRHFTGTPSKLQGHGLIEIERAVLDRHTAAFRANLPHLDEGGAHRYRRNGEAHAYDPPVIKALHTLIRTGETLDARKYARLIEGRDPIAVRDLLRVREDATAIDIVEVEAAASIVGRFSTAAMSLGSLSPEAHGALAIAMNRLGASSNSGEGGEAPENFWRALPQGDSANHRIKQVASARFGVTTDYLVAADELQIKMAQGSKPGEGGQLPGRKVVAHIARLRHSPEGVTLISPPPHHDIYSIEDLAQLVHDLKCVNPKASVSVKLVATTGIGAVAAGVVKAGADTVVIGGHDGGTGASPLSSIKNAGAPWELGLLEVQETLLDHGLRERVRLRVEGGLKTGRDVVIAAALGADEFAFGSAALVAAGCVMARQCHLNTCPKGIATQREELRRNFKGAPEDAIRFLLAIADEAREILASLGRSALEDIVGDLGVLEARVLPRNSRAARVSAAELLEGRLPPVQAASRPRQARNESRGPAFGPDEAALARLTMVHGRLAPLTLSRPITVADRSVGARLSGEVARLLRGGSLDEGELQMHFRGSAGQSFGAFAVKGIRLTLEGEANDYVGKGLSGGEIVIRKRGEVRTRRDDQVIAGNTVLYGATSGRLFAAGRVGERFAVRLSGAVAVVEGAGDHACEYMTAGTVAILGPVGRNLGAGMSGGLVYVYDPHHELDSRLNEEMVEIDAALQASDQAWLKEACRRHWEATASERVERMIHDWQASLRAFRRVKAKGQGNVVPVPWPSDRPAEDARPEPLWSVA